MQEHLSSQAYVFGGRERIVFCCVILQCTYDDAQDYGEELDGIGGIFLVTFCELEFTSQVLSHELADNPAHRGSLFGRLLLEGGMRIFRYSDHDVLVFPHRNLRV